MSFSTCGKPISCSSYFKSSNYQNLTGMKYQMSWIFNLTTGLNVINGSSTLVYQQGSMVLLQMITASVGLTDQSDKVWYVNENDCIIQGDETGNFSLAFLNRTQSNAYFQAIVVLSRHIYFENIMLFTRQFYVSGTYNMTVSLFDPETMIFYKNSTMIVRGIRHTYRI